MNSCELVAFVSSVDCALSNKCTEDELAIMAAVFSQLVDTLETILVHKEICCSDKIKKTD